MSTITLDEYEKTPLKWAIAAADTGEMVLVTRDGLPMVRITPAFPQVCKTAPLPDREDEIRKLPLTDSTAVLDEIRADRL
jgi:antitoxin (DNA-binding transcriptional repressor) of toxin-antitoxin stability system